jgi:hypothetical protein
MIQVFEPYWKWEDFQNGMYEVPTSRDLPGLAAAAKSLLGDATAFESVCRQMVEAWPVAASVNLTNVNANRRAWMGQAACSYHAKVPETATRVAWKELSNDEREAANEAAEMVIHEYECKGRGVLEDMADSWLFGRHTG